MTITLNAEKRDKIGKLDSLREKGLVPAVFYGHKEKSTPIQVKKNDFIKVWKEAGESSVITIKMEELSKDALIHEITVDPVTSEPTHIDFYVFEKGHKVEVAIPIEFIGVSPAVKTGGVLMKVMHEIKVEAEPSNLPHQIEIDISGLLEIDSQILTGDIKLPSGVTLMENPEEVIVTVAAPKAEEEEVVAPIDLSQIEVQKKGKDEEETPAEE